MAVETCEPFFKIPQKTIYKLIDSTCITSMHIAAFLVLCCFTNNEGTFTRASKESLITYAKIPRKKACQVLDDLHSFEFAVREDTDEHGRGFKISQGPSDSPVFFPVELVKSKSIPASRIARLHNNAAKLLLLAYLSHEQ